MTLIPPNSFLGKTAKFFDFRLLDTKFFIIDLWLIVHFIVGFGLGWILKDVKIYGVQFKAWMIALALLILWEVMEIVLRGTIFKGETFTNTFWDIIIGMVGFFIAKLIFRT